MHYILLVFVVIAGVSVINMDLNIYEVGPRDGLQNSGFMITTQEKIDMINHLYKAGLKNIEVTSFVHPKYVPQMADAEKVFKETKHLGNFDVLVPNQKGFDRAKKVGATNYNVFFSPSNEFNIRNLGRTLDVAYKNIQTMLGDVDRENVRAYISCAFGCPFEGLPKEHELKDSIVKAEAIADTIVLCDTIGEAYPSKILRTLETTRGVDSKIALHLHKKKLGGNNIFGNIKAALDWGVNTFDSSIGGLGGCPFIPNSGSNLSTNQLINWSNNNGYETGVELEKLTQITDKINDLKRKVVVT